jgi:hypothetical protein
VDRTAAGYFQDAAAADAAIEALEKDGFHSDRIVRAQIFEEPVAQGGTRVTVHTDDDHYDAASALLLQHGAQIRELTATGSGTTAAHDADRVGARPEDTVTAAPGTSYPDSRSSDVPPGDEMPLSYRERAEYDGAVEDVARTTETRSPDDLKPI